MRQTANERHIGSSQKWFPVCTSIGFIFIAKWCNFYGKSKTVFVFVLFADIRGAKKFLLSVSYCCETFNWLCSALHDLFSYRVIYYLWNDATRQNFWNNKKKKKICLKIERHRKLNLFHLLLRSTGEFNFLLVVRFLFTLYWFCSLLWRIWRIQLTFHFEFTPNVIYGGTLPFIRRLSFFLPGWQFFTSQTSNIFPRCTNSSVAQSLHWK